MLLFHVSMSYKEVYVFQLLYINTKDVSVTVWSTAASAGLPLNFVV